MADEQPPVQHTPKHLEDDKVFDSRHPAASPFAVAQPAAGVVANDVEERGQNLAGGPTADAASEEYSDQKEVLTRQHAESLRGAATPAAPVQVEGSEAKPAGRSSDAAKKAEAKPAENKPSDVTK